MATVSIAVQFADGEHLGVQVEVSESFPDVIAEARAEALTAFGVAVRDLLEVEGT